MPQPVATRTVKVYIPTVKPLPDDWTADCVIAPVHNPATNSALLDIIYNLIDGIIECNIRLDKIRHAQTEGTLK